MLEVTFRTGVALLALLVALVMLAPQPALAQSGMGAIIGAFNAVNQTANRVLGFISDTMRPVLDAVRLSAQVLDEFMTRFRNLWEQVVWPLDEIARARSLASQLIVRFRAALNGLYFLSVHSATLEKPARLEAAMRDRQPDGHGQLLTAYREAFGRVPGSTEAHWEERTLIDVDDALAINQLMALKLADASAEQTVRAAEAMEDEAERFAPGTAAMASAAAQIASLQSQAHIQKMIAGQLRLEATRLAHETMSLKRGAVFSKASREQTRQLNERE